MIEDNDRTKVWNYFSSSEVLCVPTKHKGQFLLSWERRKEVPTKHANKFHKWPKLLTIERWCLRRLSLCSSLTEPPDRQTWRSIYCSLIEFSCDNNNLDMIQKFPLFKRFNKMRRRVKTASSMMMMRDLKIGPFSEAAPTSLSLSSCHKN